MSDGTAQPGDVFFAGPGRTGSRRVRVSGFEVPMGMGPEELAAYRRRFSTLFVDDGTARRGGLGVVSRAANALGETVALKVLVDPARAEFETDESHAARVELARAAFRAEYESHRALSSFKGFPKLYAYGVVDGSPAILMEWVEGVTLDLAAHMLACDEAGRLAPLVAARIGRDLFDVLSRLRLVGDGFVHRDISPSNILVRTERLSLAEQAAGGSFDLCLIDFGSSVNRDPELDSAYTTRYATLRCATLDYAPPEMLTGDLPGLIELRKSDKIDVYAAASVLHELVAGVPPFDMASRSGSSPYRIKVDTSPATPVTAHQGTGLAEVLSFEPEVLAAATASMLDVDEPAHADVLARALGVCDTQLAEMIAAGLAPAQGDRPDATTMRDGLARFCAQYPQNFARAVKGERLLPCWGEQRPRHAVPAGRVNRMVAMAGVGVAVAALIAVICINAVLLDGVRVVLRFGSFVARGEIVGPLAGFSLTLPAFAALIGRGRSGGTRRGFIRGTAGLVTAALGLLLLVECTRMAGVPSSSPLVASVLLAASAAWVPLVLEYVLTVFSGRGDAMATLPRAAAEPVEAAVVTAADPEPRYRGKHAAPGVALVAPSMRGDEYDPAHRRDR